MHLTLAHVRVRVEHADDALRAAPDHHRASVAEPGNRRFHVLQQADAPAAFVLDEACPSAEDAAAHSRTPRYPAWRAPVEPRMAQPRQGIGHRALAPLRAADR